MYEELGVMVLGRWSGSPGREMDFVETRQHRKCSVCGKVQDEIVKDGPMPKFDQARQT
jgi:hypothetical protein